MTSIARGMSVSDYNTRSVIVFALIIALVVAMFFIPEIVGVDNKQTAEVSDELLARRRARAGEQVQAPAASDAVAQKDVQKEMSKQEVEERPFESPLKKLLGLFGSGADSKKSQAVDIKDAKIGDSGPIDWKNLRSRETKRFLTKAERDARKLGKVIDDQYEQSKFALYNFANGIRNVLKGSNKSMSADEAVQYLAKFDSEVTTSMLAEGVESAVYNEWADITLGPVFENTKEHQTKIAKRFPFNPQFRLLWVKIFQPADHYGRFIENGKAYVSFRASVQGRDVRKITIFANGVKQAERVPRFRKGTTTRIFTHLNREARGIYTFRVYDKRGRFVDRSYNFYMVARKFPWLPKRKGKFDIPFMENDPRLDALFLFQSSSEAKQVTYFSADSSGAPGTSF